MDRVLNQGSADERAAHLRREFHDALTLEQRAGEALLAGLRGEGPRAVRDLTQRWEDAHEVTRAAAHEFNAFMTHIGRWNLRRASRS
jgi:hypothetical protein